MNQKRFWSSKFALLFSSLVLGFKAAYLRESICACTLPGALSTVSIFVSSKLPYVSEVFFVRLFCFLSFRHRGCRGNCFPIQKTNSLWSSCHLFWMCPRFFLFFYLLCLSFFVLNNVFLVWSGENGILGLDNHHHTWYHTRPRRGWKKAAGFPPKSGVWCERCEFVCAARHTTPAWWWGFGTVVICPKNDGDMSTRENWELWKETSQKAGVLKWCLFGINSEF